MMNDATLVTTCAEAQFISVIETSPHSAWAIAGALSAPKATASVSFFMLSLLSEWLSTSLSFNSGRRSCAPPALGPATSRRDADGDAWHSARVPAARSMLGSPIRQTLSMRVLRVAGKRKRLGQNQPPPGDAPTVCTADHATPAMVSVVRPGAGADRRRGNRACDATGVPGHAGVPGSISGPPA